VVEDDCIGAIHLDNEGAALLIMQHLIEEGRRRIALIGGPADRRSFQQRMSGYRKALEHAGLPFKPELIINGPITEDGGRMAMEQLIAQALCLDAVFAASDRLAVGVLAALEAVKVRVPQDVAVAGFDNIPIAPYLHPALTTVAPPYDLIGRHAAIMLFDQLINNAAPRREVLPCGLQIRASST
jgi:DNA-binding LacI/PurR family transcriptional regulator